jgi:hypothetical protein
MWLVLFSLTISVSAGVPAMWGSMEIINEMKWYPLHFLVIHTLCLQGISWKTSSLLLYSHWYILVFLWVVWQLFLSLPSGCSNEVCSVLGNKLNFNSALKLLVLDNQVSYSRLERLAEIKSTQENLVRYTVKWFEGLPQIVHLVQQKRCKLLTTLSAHIGSGVLLAHRPTGHKQTPHRSQEVL